MSGVRRLFTFALVKKGASLAVSKSIDQHAFIYDASDLAVMHGNLHILAEMGGIQGLAAALRSDLKTGLYADEVDQNTYLRRRDMYGWNKFAKAPLLSFWEHCWNQLQDPVLRILIVAGIISIIVGAVDDPGHGWVEGLAIIIAVLLVTTVGGFNNMRQERSFRALDESKGEEQYKVWRNGKLIRINQSEVVVGDLVELAAGDEIPADGVYVAGDDPACNEAKMTGESRDVEKNMTKPFLLAGTELRRGQVLMLTTSVGPNCSFGRIMSALAQEIEPTPLQHKLEAIAELVGKIGAGFAAAVFIVLVSFWIKDMVENNLSFKSELSNLVKFVIIAITLIVVAVPEGLPLAVTISLAYSMKQMVKDQNLVRILSACETMGNATAICSDKTGTLTQNEMTVIRGWVGGSVQDKLVDAPPLDDATRRLLVQGVVVNSKASHEYDPATKKWNWKGNQTELALMKWLSKYNINIQEERDNYLILKNYPFDSMKKNSSIIIRVDNKYRRYYKGAAEQLFQKCTTAIDASGRIVPMARYQNEIWNVIDGMTKTGLRTIAFAYVDFDTLDKDPTDPMKFLDPPESEELTFFGVVGIKDPLRPEARRSVRIAQRAGIVVRMVTGDHPETAKFIAQECGILTSQNHIVMTGEEFRRLMDAPAEAEVKIPRMRVLARSKPEDKQKLVKWLKDHGEVVAATGDGTNDAPALKEANVGLAMNLVGTAVAKAAAQILILDDNFSSIVKSIMWGRAVFDNIRKFIQFQLTINLVALCLSLIGSLSRYETPLRAVQLLWVNLIMDTMAALALGTEPPTLKLLDRKPYLKDVSIVSKVMWRNIAGHAVLQLTILLVLLYDGAEILNVESKSVRHYTMIFNTFVWLQLFNEFNAREVNEGMNPFKGVFKNHIYMGILAITIFFQFLMVQYFGSFAQTEGLNAAEWFICIGFGALSIPFGALIRLIPVDNTHGMVKISPETFEGANLDVIEADEHDSLL